MWQFVFLLNVAVALTETSTFLFCVPHQLKEWDTVDLTQSVKQCLLDNYVHKAASLSLGKYIAAYQDAWSSKQRAEAADNLLYHNKRELMLYLRDTKLKAANHMHAIQKCAAIGHRMPRVIMDAYTDEAEMMFRVMGVWTHHSRVELEHCGLLLNNIVSKTHHHTVHHILTRYHVYTTQLAKVSLYRAAATVGYQTMLRERDDILNI